MVTNKSKFLDPRSDLVFKKIFGHHPDLVKSFLNSILPLPEDRLIESVSYLTPEQAPRIPSMKNTIVDVKCTDQRGRVFIVEMQMAWNKNFMKRFLFGTAKAYIQQLDAGKTYDNLCPVYGLAIIDEQFEYKTSEWFHHYRLTNTKDADAALEGIEMVFVELPKFNPETFEHRRLGRLWLRFLKETKDMQEIPDDFKENAELVKAIELSQESAYSRQELEAYDYYLDAVRVEQLFRLEAAEAKEEKAKAEEQKAKAEEQKAKAEEQKAKAEAELKKEKEKADQRLKEIACKLIQQGMSVQDIAELMGLSVEQIK